MEQPTTTNVEKVEVFQGVASSGSWYWRGKAGNGEIVTTSESYTTKHDAKRAAKATFPEIDPVVV